MCEKIIKFIIIKLLFDIVFGVIAAVFAHFLLGSLLPSILNGLHAELGNAGIAITLFSFSVDPAIFQKWFSIWNCFCLLFGFRFLVAYISGHYKG